MPTDTPSTLPNDRIKKFREQLAKDRAERLKIENEPKNVGWIGGGPSWDAPPPAPSSKKQPSLTEIDGDGKLYE